MFYLNFLIGGLTYFTYVVIFLHYRINGVSLKGIFIRARHWVISGQKNYYLIKRDPKKDTFATQKKTKLSMTMDKLIFQSPHLHSGKMSLHQSPLRIDVTSSSDHHDDSSPYSLTDSAMGGSAMSPEPLDETNEINGSASSAHDKSHCSSMSDDREVNFESYGENNDKWVIS